MTADETLDETPPTDDQQATEESVQTDQRDDRGHLADVADGAGCTEIWEHLSEQREDESDEE